MLLTLCEALLLSAAHAFPTIFQRQSSHIIPTVAFTKLSGANVNTFYRDDNIAAQILTTSNASALQRLVFASPADVCES